MAGSGLNKRVEERSQGVCRVIVVIVEQELKEILKCVSRNSALCSNKQTKTIFPEKKKNWSPLKMNCLVFFVAREPYCCSFPRHGEDPVSLAVQLQGH